MSDESGVYKIRPAGSHLATIGSGLIKDQYAAVMELVKNAFDADSPDVKIKFKSDTCYKSIKSPYNNSKIEITIEDHGHGMTRDVVLGKWLVPSTDDKLKRQVSPGGRIMQGRKGIGRYSAAVLGDDLLLETTDKRGITTSIYILWKDFNNAEFLDQVDVLVESKRSGMEQGTRLIINCGSYSDSWTPADTAELSKELKKLISPVDTQEFDGTKVLKDSFDIFIEYCNYFCGEPDKSEQIHPVPLFDLYDYRIKGVIESSGTGSLVFSNQKAVNTVDEPVQILLNHPTGCGRLIVDIRVFDRDPESIDGLIKRGPLNDNGHPYGKHEIRRLLNMFNGIGVYRNGFRIRPLGDPQYDWLELNRTRVQNPSLRIGSDQAMGYVLIESEEKSGLEEKSARDGLKENGSYKNFIGIVRNVVLAELERRRFIYRRKTGLNKRTVSLDKKLSSLFEYDKLKKNVRYMLESAGVRHDTVIAVAELIDQEEENKNKSAEEIRRAIAIYQGQATLGKIINVIMHEGRRPLSYFKSQIKNFEIWYKLLKKEYKREYMEEVTSILSGMKKNSQVFSDLFDRLDPLAARKRDDKKDYNIPDIVNDAIKVFENELDMNGICVHVDADSKQKIVYKCWYADLFIIFTNLFDNSIYWLTHCNKKAKMINIVIHSDAEEYLDYIDFYDSGPGIKKEFIENTIIFDPEFSTKPDGTGLGLAIAGEAAERNNLTLSAIDYKDGAYFRIGLSEAYDE